MLGRRQLREKAMQAIYAYKIDEESANERTIEKNMLKGVGQIYDLYIYLLNLINFQKKIAEHKIELGKKKNLPTAEDLNPNLKFVNNAMFRILDENEELNEFTSKNKQLTWDLLDAYPNRIFKNITSSPEYDEYMASGKNSFEEDKAFIVDVFKKYIAPDEGLAEWVEELNINWSDDLHIANSMTVVTLNSFVEHSTGKLKLFKVFKEDEDRQFIVNLYRRTIQNSKETLGIIEEKAKNWELDRIAAIDLILLQMALTEFHFFPNIPPKVTLDEYIELSKVYSTEKSKVFINGILDKSMKEMNRIQDKLK